MIRASEFVRRPLEGSSAGPDYVGSGRVGPQAHGRALSLSLSLSLAWSLPQRGTETEARGGGGRDGIFGEDGTVGRKGITNGNHDVSFVCRLRSPNWDARTEPLELSHFAPCYTRVSGFLFGTHFGF